MLKASILFNIFSKATPNMIHIEDGDKIKTRQFLQQTNIVKMVIFIDCE